MIELKRDRVEIVYKFKILAHSPFDTIYPMGNNWHTLKLMVKGDLFTVYMDDKELFQVQDTTFENSGKVGF